MVEITKWKSNATKIVKKETEELKVVATQEKLRNKLRSQNIQLKRQINTWTASVLFSFPRISVHFLGSIYEEQNYPFDSWGLSSRRMPRNGTPSVYTARQLTVFTDVCNAYVHGGIRLHRFCTFSSDDIVLLARIDTFQSKWHSCRGRRTDQRIQRQT